MGRLGAEAVPASLTPVTRHYPLFGHVFTVQVPGGYPGRRDPGATPITICYLATCSGS